MVKCNFCKDEYSLNVIKLHKERCVKNPKNIKKEFKKDANKNGDATNGEDKKDTKKVK